MKIAKTKGQTATAKATAQKTARNTIEDSPTNKTNDGNGLHNYKKLKNWIVFLKAKKEDLRRCQEKTEAELLTAMEKANSHYKRQFKTAIENLKTEYTNFNTILTDLIEAKLIEPTEEDILDYIQKHEDDPLIGALKIKLEIEGTNEAVETQLKGIVYLMLSVKAMVENITKNYNLIKDYTADNEEIQRIKQEIIEYIKNNIRAKSNTTAQPSDADGSPTNQGDNHNITLKTVKSDNFQISTERFINNLIKREYETKQQIEDSKYFYFFDLNLKNREDCPYIFNKSDFLTMQDTLYLNGILTLYNEAKRKELTYIENLGDGKFNTFYGFFLIDLYNLLNGKKDRGEISREALEALKKELYKLSCTWIKIETKRKDGRDLKTTDKRENFYRTGINSQLIYFKTIWAKRESDGINKKTKGDEGKIEFISFFEEPILLRLRNLKNTVTRVDKRLMEIKQPNQNSQEVNFYLIRTIELLKTNGGQKINIGTIEKSLTKEIKTAQQKKDLKKLIKKRLEYFKSLDYIRDFKINRDSIQLKIDSKKSIEKSTEKSTKIGGKLGQKTT